MDFSQTICFGALLFCCHCGFCRDDSGEFYKFDVLSAFLLRTGFKFKANLNSANRCCESAGFKLF